MKHFISLGAGVQSSAMALMAANKEITPMPEAAIFADTQAEPQSVYDWLDWLEKQLPFPVYKVTAGDLWKDSIEMKTSKDGRKYTKTLIPLFTYTEEKGQGMMPYRLCTVDYKVKPLSKKVKELAGVKRGEKNKVVTQWIGISLDESRRMKPSREKWSEHRWPLIEMRMTRQACKDWMQAKGYPEPPRSACVFCPFHSNAEWQRLKTQEPAEFERAVQFEQELQEAKSKTRDNMHSTPYLHRSCKPIDQVDTRSDFDKGQLPLWDDECEGMCGI